MKKRLCKCLSHITIFVLVFSMICSVTVCKSIHVKAQEQSSIERVANVIGFDIDLNSKIDLHDKNDNIIAYFYKSNTIGYLIVNALTNKPIEYSNEINRNFFDDIEKKYYYDGPFAYYVEETATTIKGIKDETIDKSELSFVVEYNNFEANSFKKLDARALTQTTYTPRNYSYNPNYICASTASAILLMYYNDHVNTNYVPTAYESTGTGEKTVKYLVPYINPYNRGATIAEIKSGLNKYLKDRGLSQTATILASSEVQLPIGSNRPVIIGVKGHSKYKDHAMVAYGYNRYSEGTSTIYMLMVVDGWGSTGVYVDRDYCIGGVKI